MNCQTDVLVASGALIYVAGVLVAATLFVTVEEGQAIAQGNPSAADEDLQASLAALPGSAGRSPRSSPGPESSDVRNQRGGSRLGAFFASLRGSTPTEIVQVGDSHTAAEIFPESIRAGLRERFSNVRLSSFGFDGARARHFLSDDSPISTSRLHKQLSSAESVDLLVVALGTNEAHILGHAMRKWEGPEARLERWKEKYQNDFHRLIESFLKKIKGDPSCLVLFPPDLEPQTQQRCQRRRFPSLDQAVCVPPENRALGAVIEAQGRAADSAGCATFSLLDSMGGRGSIKAWQKYNPPLAQNDGAHFTELGYERLGQRVAAELFRRFQ